MAPDESPSLFTKTLHRIVRAVDDRRMPGVRYDAPLRGGLLFRLWIIRSGTLSIRIAGVLSPVPPNTCSVPPPYRASSGSPLLTKRGEQSTWSVYASSVPAELSNSSSSGTASREHASTGLPQFRRSYDGYHPFPVRPRDRSKPEFRTRFWPHYRDQLSIARFREHALLMDGTNTSRCE